MTKFWLTLAHIAVAGAGVAGAIFFPPAAIPIIGAVSLLNGLIPSPVATVAPLDYGMLIGTTAIGFFVFGELPDALVFVGAAIVIATGLYIIYADTRRV